MKPYSIDELCQNDYARAEKLLPSNLNNVHVFGTGVSPVAIVGTSRFWFRSVTREGGYYIIVDSVAGTQERAFDHECVTEQLCELTKQSLVANQLPLSKLDFYSQGKIGLHLQATRFVLDIASGVVTLDKHGGVAFNEVASPDGRWAAFTRDHDFFLRDLGSGEEHQLTDDGCHDYAYAAHADSLGWSHEFETVDIHLPPPLIWSPDSSVIMTHVLDQAGMHQQHYIQASPAQDGPPVLRTKRSSIPGCSKVPQASLVVIDVVSMCVKKISAPSLPMPYLPPEWVRRVWFSEDGATVYAVNTDRLERQAEFIVINPVTGIAKTLVTEKSDTHLDLHPLVGRSNIHTSGKTLIWWSERSGWGHLYRYDLDSGELLNVITAGEWLVYSVLAVDEAAGFVWFTGTGREPGDLYQQRLYRAPLAGGEPELLDAEVAHHQITAVGDRFVDTFSTVKELGSTVLRDRDGKVTMPLLVPDSDDLEALGFNPPERVAVTAPDGKTALWATVYLPPKIAKNVVYPVLDDIYPGPQMTRCPVSMLDCLVGRGMGDAAALASLGFIVVQVDGRGTPGRSKAFHDHSYGQIQCASDLDDHEAAIHQLAKRFPLDLERVGIFGSSGGGFASTRAVFTKPEFYRVAVSFCGNHDQRIYWSNWGEKYHGPIDEVDYQEQANANHVENFNGRLLLIHGEMDDNVSPAHTLRVVDTLVQADADFDMIIVPNAGHAFIGKQAFVIRRRWDYFVRHLLGAQPPQGYRLKEPPFVMPTLG